DVSERGRGVSPRAARDGEDAHADRARAARRRARGGGPAVMRDFDELVGGGDLEATERERLERVHDLLVAAGPPPELPPALEQAPAQLGSRDKAGNWPMLVNVTGLREVGTGGYYNIYLTKAGRPVVLCGSFVVHGDRTTVQYSEPYSLAHFDGWVVTLQTPRKHEPGRVVLRTSDV